MMTYLSHCNRPSDGTRLYLSPIFFVAHAAFHRPLEIFWLLLSQGFWRPGGLSSLLKPLARLDTAFKAKSLLKPFYQSEVPCQAREVQFA